jgi:predicted Zn-dependent protease
MTKRQISRLGIMVVLGLGLAACAVTPRSGEQGTAPYPGQESTGLGNPAIVALLDNADAQEKDGHLEQAGAALERALRLEPRNAMLWHRLARVRLKQGQLQMAVDMAAKSNSLAGGDVDLQSWNWALIAEAKEQQGDSKGAEAARAHLNGAGVSP